MTTSATQEFASWSELMDAVDSNAGVSMVSMGALRRLEGAQRAREGVRNAIKSQLTKFGLGTVPEEMPRTQADFVVIYRMGTAAGNAVEAIREGLVQNSVGREVYQALYNLNTAPSPEEVKTVVQDAVATGVSTALNSVGDKVDELLSVPETEPVPAPEATSAVAETQRELEPAYAPRVRTRRHQTSTNRGVPTGFSS